jgi:hypothetical protein
MDLCDQLNLDAIPEPVKATVSLNKKVPVPSSPVTGGKSWKLSDAAGKKLVCISIPKDNTTGCTLEGQAFATCTPRSKAGTIVPAFRRQRRATRSSRTSEFR